jgi:alpha-D-ribose 1-methylphosphonate 5-triphosphate diphosphatase
VLTNARIIAAEDEIRGTVVVRGGVIASVDAGRSSLPAAIDLEGDLLIPGLIELHTDNIERHVMPRPAAPWPVDAAVVAHDREVVGAGITTVFDAVSVGEVHSRTGRAEILKQICEAVNRRHDAGDLVADHRLHLRCELSYGCLIDMFDPLIDDPLVGLLSVMDHTPGQRQFRDVAVYARYYQGKFAMSDEELAEFIETRKADQNAHARANRAHVVQAARDRGLALASHDDATADHVGEAVDDGVVIAEFPTTTEAARASRAGGLSVLMGAPNLVRGHSHSGNVSARELAAAGVLDILSSDYIPSSLLFGALTLTRLSDPVDLASAVRAVTLTPARRVGLGDRGEIAVAKRADLVRVRDCNPVPVIRGVWRAGEKVA